MPKIALCVALYEAGRPFLDAFAAGVRAAAARHELTLVAAVDGLDDPAAALSGLAGHAELRLVDVPPGHTPAGVRRYMLTAGQASDADTLVFIDMDDVLAPDAIDLHLAALQEADFSFGDMDLIDRAGRLLGRRFFDDCDVPERVDDVAVIGARNFLGFSNTAVRATRIAPVALSVPDTVVAADWWFFTMLLLGGLQGRRTAGPVSAYRVHDANTLGAGAPRTVAQAIRQTEAMLRHYRAFSALPALAERAAAAERMLQDLCRTPEAQRGAPVATMNDGGGAWFEGIAQIAGNADGSTTSARPAR